MKSIYEILDFYNLILNKNLFKEEVFSTSELFKIRKELNAKSNELILFIRNKIVINKLNVKALQALINELNDIQTYTFSEAHHLIDDMKQNPLFRYKIGFKYKTLQIGYSCISIANELADLINQLYREYPNDIVIENQVRSIGHAVPYLNQDGYKRHIFLKFLSSDYIKNEFYNHSHLVANKINEFLEYCSECSFHLPIGSKDNYNHKDYSDNKQDKDISSLIAEIENSSAAFNQAFFFFQKQNFKDWLDSYFESSKMFPFIYR